jgi:hypothetical protein
MLRLAEAAGAPYWRSPPAPVRIHGGRGRAIDYPCGARSIGMRRAAVAVLLSAVALLASGCGSAGAPDGTIEGLAIGACGPAGPNFSGAATVAIIENGQTVKTTSPLVLGSPYRVQVPPGSYLVKFGHVKSPMIPGPAVHVSVKSGKTVRADLGPLCPRSAGAP